MNRTNIIKACATIAMGYRCGFALKRETIVFANGVADDLHDQFSVGVFAPCLEAIVFMAGEAMANVFLGAKIDVNSYAVQNCRRIARTHGADEKEFFRRMIEFARQRFISDESIGWATLRLAEELSSANALAAHQIESILTPYVKYWLGEAPSPVGTLRKNDVQLSAVNEP